MGLILVIGLVIWIVCGVLAYGFDLAYFQRHWPNLAKKDYLQDRLKAIPTGLLGPFGLALCLVEGFCKYGFRWW